jgi:hypothetical protein
LIVAGAQGLRPAPSASGATASQLDSVEHEGITGGFLREYPPLARGAEGLSGSPVALEGPPRIVPHRLLGHGCREFGGSEGSVGLFSKPVSVAGQRSVLARVICHLSVI